MVNIVYENDVIEWRETVSHVMKENEEAFNPAFSKREGGFEKQVDNYVNEKKELLRAVEDGCTVGVLIFERGEVRDAIEEYCPCLYINLIIIDQKYRNQGIGTKLYRYIQNKVFPDCRYDKIGVRTWEENKASQRCIKKAGFEKVSEEEGDHNHLFYYIYDSSK